jgi:hypothetical protein
MHHALSINEILFIVFSYLNRHVLAQVARVCRTWSAPALDLIWTKAHVGLHFQLLDTIPAFRRARYHYFLDQSISKQGMSTFVNLSKEALAAMGNEGAMDLGDDLAFLQIVSIYFFLRHSSQLIRSL